MLTFAVAVGTFGNGYSNPNTFQLILASDGVRSFVIYNYAAIKLVL